MIFSHVLYQLSYLACRELPASGPRFCAPMQNPEYNMRFLKGTVVENVGHHASAR